ncbi:MAG: DUF7352 domain-containing protein [Solirubrobacterales bacterium]
MNTTIWKFALVPADLQHVMMPKGALILCAQAQGEAMELWAMVNPELPRECRLIEIIGTGHPIPEGVRSYISTVQMMNGALVWHIFERTHTP